MVIKAKKKVTKKATKKKAVKKKTSVKSSKKAAPKHGHCKFDEALIPIIKNLAYRGKTHSGIAELLGISEGTFYNWKNEYPDLLKALEEAKGDPIKKVEAALFERAVGYSCVETKTHLTKSGVIKTKNIIKNYPPSETAQKYYLGNKDPDNWKEKREVTVDAGESIRSLSLAFNTDESPDDLDKRGGDDPDEDSNG